VQLNVVNFPLAKARRLQQNAIHRRRVFADLKQQTGMDRFGMVAGVGHLHQKQYGIA
jgi:hypothetical protein